MYLLLHLLFTSPLHITSDGTLWFPSLTTKLRLQVKLLFDETFDSDGILFSENDVTFSGISSRHLLYKKYRKTLLICPPYISPPRTYAPQIYNPIKIPNLTPPPPNKKPLG